MLVRAPVDTDDLHFELFRLRFHLSKANILKYWKQYWKSSCRCFHMGLN